MASRNAEKQQRYRQRLQERGLVHVQGWATPAQAEAIRRILAERGRDESPTEYERTQRHAPSGAASRTK